MRAGGGAEEPGLDCRTEAASCGGKIENLGIRDSQVFLCHGLICDFAPCGTENPEAENPVLSILQSQLLSENGGSRYKVTVSLDTKVAASPHTFCWRVRHGELRFAAMPPANFFG